MKAYLKAFVGSLVAALAALVTALDDEKLSVQEGLTAAIAFLVALGVIWAVPNEEV